MSARSPAAFLPAIVRESDVAPGGSTLSLSTASCPTTSLWLYIEPIGTLVGWNHKKSKSKTNPYGKWVNGCSLG
jgi:hypothetical protein